jgi:hypothetical protein
VTGEDNIARFDSRRYRSDDIKFKLPVGQDKFQVTTRPIHKLIMVILTEEQTLADEIESGAADGNNGRDAHESMQLYANLLSKQERTSTHPRLTS